MKTIIKITSTIFLAVFAISCGQPSESEQTTAEGMEDHVKIQLDDGALWRANPETNLGISNMADMMAAMADMEREDVDSYNVLSESLLEQFNMIFDKCTMTGEAHEQLHKYMLPMKEMFESMAANDLDTCKDAYERLSGHLAEYPDYFE